MDVESYLRRIGVTQSASDLPPTWETLEQLAYQHLITVPFETLDIRRMKPIPLSVEETYEKVVGGRRGGLCFELNPLFGWLLEQLGYSVDLLESCVNMARDPVFIPPHRIDEFKKVWEFDGEGVHEKDKQEDEGDDGSTKEPVVRDTELWRHIKTHALLLVRSETMKEPAVVDVAAADPPAGPIWLRLKEPQKLRDGHTYRITREGPVFYREKYWPRNYKSDTFRDEPIEKREGGVWIRSFKWTMDVVNLERFREALEYTQGSPESSLTQKSVLTFVTDTERYTLAGMKLIVTDIPFGKRSERMLQDKEEYQKVLKQHFGIDLEIDHPEYPLYLEGDLPCFKQT